MSQKPWHALSWLQVLHAAKLCCSELAQGAAVSFTAAWLLSLKYLEPAIESHYHCCVSGLHNSMLLCVPFGCSSSSADHGCCAVLAAAASVSMADSVSLRKWSQHTGLSVTSDALYVGLHCGNV